MAMLTQSEHAVLNDDEISLDNLVEGKHHKLSRSVRSGLTDRDLKPDAGTRDQLNEIVESPPTKTLDSEEQDLVWKFRFYLSNQKKVGSFHLHVHPQSIPISGFLRIPEDPRQCEHQ